MSSDFDFTEVIKKFTALKDARRSDPINVLEGIKKFSLETHSDIHSRTAIVDICWVGSPKKEYVTLVIPEHLEPWSRPIRKDLYIWDASEYQEAWENFAQHCNRSAGRLRLEGVSATEANRLLYTAVMSWAIATDLFNRSNGLAGTFFEIIIGTVVSILTDRPVRGEVKIPLEGEKFETVKVDLTFPEKHGDKVLAIPTKFSTRERVSQPYVHAAILDTAFPGKYRTVLCVVNETNAFYPTGVPKAERTAETLRVKETVVPQTIHLYEKYISQLDGLVYLDAPDRYVNSGLDAFPPVQTVGDFLTSDSLREACLPSASS